MDHTERIFISLLNLSPNSVVSIYSSTDESNHLSIFVTLARRKMDCPYCGNSALLSKGFYTRSVSVPNRAFENVSVLLKVPCYKCTCGHNFSDFYAMSPANSKVSFDSIRLIMELLQNPKMTFSCRCSSNRSFRIYCRSCF